MSFIYDMFVPRDRVADILDDAEEEGMLGLECKKWSFGYFLLGFLTIFLYVGVKFYLQWGTFPLVALLKEGVITGFSFLMVPWINAFALAVAADKLGGRGEIYRIFLAPATVILPLLVVAMMYFAIVLGVPYLAFEFGGKEIAEFATLIVGFIATALGTYFGFSYSLGLISGATNLSFLRSFAASILAVLISGFLYFLYTIISSMIP